MQLNKYTHTHTHTQDGNGDGCEGGNKAIREDGSGDGDGKVKANGEGIGGEGELWYPVHQERSRVEDQTLAFRTWHHLCK